MKRLVSLMALAAVLFAAASYAGPKKVGVVVTIKPEGMAVIHSNGKTTTVKNYTEIKAGDVIEIKKAGKVEIILSNFEKVILKNPRKIKINEDFTVVDADSNKKDDGKKKDKFAEDIARDMSADNNSVSGASRGDSKGGDNITAKVKAEIAEAEKIEDEFLRHTAKYHIYRKYDCKQAMAIEAKILADMKNGK